MMTTLSNATAENGKATTVKKTFSRETTVSTNIHASPETIWALLTNAPEFPKWNTTVISIDGNIKLGETIKLKSTLDPKRTFKLKIKEFDPNKKLVWGDGSGNRVYTLIDNGNGTVTFTMDEKIGVVMFPMCSKYIPPFDQSFEQFAADLKKKAESK